MKAIQYIAETADESQALALLSSLRLQVCFLGGRLLPPCGQLDKNSWRVQSFHTADGCGETLPDGCRFVFVPKSLLAS
jgi:hypothetical protein